MEYVYNDFGQLITEYRQDTDGDGTWNLIQSRTSNKVNEITNITETVGTSWTTPVYNKSGNMVTLPTPNNPTTSYTATYDAWNRLVKLTDGSNTITEYQYDGLRRRIIHKVYNTGVLDYTKHLYYNTNWQLLEERRDTNTSPTKQYIWGNRYIDNLVLRDHDTNNDGTLNERLYALQDTNWNVTSFINETGTVLERYIYNAYGSVTFLDNNFGVISNSTIEPDHLYAGYNYDADVEMYHVRNRVYHPMLGTWLQRDPIGYDGGINLYRYLTSATLVNSDPFGLLDPIPSSPEGRLFDLKRYCVERKSPATIFLDEKAPCLASRPEWLKCLQCIKQDTLKRPPKKCPKIPRAGAGDAIVVSPRLMEENQLVGVYGAGPCLGVILIPPTPNKPSQRSAGPIMVFHFSPADSPRATLDRARGMIKQPLNPGRPWWGYRAYICGIEGNDDDPSQLPRMNLAQFMLHANLLRIRIAGYVQSPSLAVDRRGGIYNINPPDNSVQNYEPDLE